MPYQSPVSLREREREKHKMRIWYLLLQEKLQVEEIRDRMKSEGFSATLKDYQSRLKSWGFFRNNPKATRNYITHRVEKRQSQGKKSVVVVTGIQWSDQKIRKETCRNFYTTQERLRDASPCTPPGPTVLVFTPPPVDPIPQNAQLDALATYLRDREPDYRPLSSVLKRYPQAYSSSTLELICDIIRPNNCVKYLPMLHDLLRRRRPEFVDECWELVALMNLVNVVVGWGSTHLLSIIDVLLSQPPSLLGPNRSYPWFNPFLEVIEERFPLSSCQHAFNKNQYPHSSEEAQNKFINSGFRADAAIGFLAIQGGCSANELEQIMDLGFDPTQRYRWSHTALQYAVLEGDLDVVRLLLSRGVSVNDRPCWGGPPEDIFTVKFPDAIFTEIYWDLLPEVCRTSLQFAVERGDMQCAELLVSRGADVNAPPAHFAGGTALQLAAIKGSLGLVRWLLELGAEVHASGATEEGMTAMEGAAALGRTDVVRLLFEYGNFKDGEQRREYIRAVGYARNSAHQVLRFYMERQIDWSTEDEEALAQEVLVEVRSYKDLTSMTDEQRWGWDRCRDGPCAGASASVDEEMEGPACCQESKKRRGTPCLGSEDGESVSDSQDSSDNESSCSTEAMPNSRGQGSPKSHDGENTLWAPGEDQLDSAATPSHGEILDDFWESHQLDDGDLGFLPNAVFGDEILPPTTGGVALGEASEGEEAAAEPTAPC
ncbi:ankyrin [Apiospora phragmitis]|uniref:Ankyrin n=1 Tax=Apiospora phragmitis TaxID=2905665 RepID=A0ABR1VK05_9PEZI